MPKVCSTRSRLKRPLWDKTSGRIPKYTLLSSALSNTKDSPVLLDYLEESEVHRQQAHNALDKYKRENEGFASFRVDRVDRVIKARGGERTNYYVNFSMRNCSTQYFHRRPPVFGFCRAVLSYNVDVTDLETPENIDTILYLTHFLTLPSASSSFPSAQPGNLSMAKKYKGIFIL
ncbi:histidine-rich glycoprotein-like [Alexandromys fortis]|uniref:histidine-rich glycoprotein-like n=1 Tax=Alexandromys fortis TaxID=100897 RepID=UPI002152D263|nr:histidine-rich glycoprotein-like [Microtus fortis]